MTTTKYIKNGRTKRFTRDYYICSIIGTMRSISTGGIIESSSSGSGAVRVVLFIVLKYIFQIIIEKYYARLNINNWY